MTNRSDVRRLQIMTNAESSARIKIQNARNTTREILARAQGLSSEEIWPRKAWWLAHTDEDHREGVQCLLILILETLGAEILDFAASSGKVERFHVAQALTRRKGFERVSSSRFQAAIRRWARGAENPHAERALTEALAEPAQRSACVYRGAL